jgi:hypothetical protein
LSNETNQRECVEKHIVRYLLAHPAAADSADGITHWWLRDMHEVSKGVIEDALGELVRRRLLVTRGSAPDTSIYALGEAGKALRFLKGEPPDG